MMYKKSEKMSYYHIPDVLQMGLKCNKLAPADIIFIREIVRRPEFRKFWEVNLDSYIRLINKLELEFDIRLNSHFTLQSIHELLTNLVVDHK